MKASQDIKTFNSIFRDYQPRFLRFAFSYLRDETEAEDVVMEAFLYYWEHRLELDQESTPPAYILTTIKHKCLNKLRNTQRQLEITKEIASQQQQSLELRVALLEECNPSELFTEDVRMIINQTLHELPSQTQKIFELSRYENKKYAEIATLLDISIKTVEYHISKAIKALRINLVDYIPLLLLLWTK